METGKNREIQVEEIGPKSEDITESEQIPVPSQERVWRCRCKLSRDPGYLTTT